MATIYTADHGAHFSASPEHNAAVLALCVAKAKPGDTVHLCAGEYQGPATFPRGVSMGSDHPPPLNRVAYWVKKVWG